MRLGVVALGFFAAMAGPRAMARGPQVIVVPASADTTIYQDQSNPSADLSNGQGGGLFAGRTTGNADVIQRGLIRFDLDTIPVSAVIQSVQVKLTLQRGAPGSPALPVSLHRMLNPWGEGASAGGGSGAPSAPGDASWEYSKFAATRWDNSGGDFDPDASATSLVPAVPATYTWGSTPALVADVTAWVQSPSTNNGWLVHNVETSGTARMFISRDAGAPESAPTLIVTYTPGSPACNLADITLIGGTAEDPGTPDGQLTVDDIIVFINLFSDGTGCPGAAPCSPADVCGIGGPPEPADGQLTVDDIIAFFNAFSDGC